MFIQVFFTMVDKLLLIHFVDKSRTVGQNFPDLSEKSSNKGLSFSTKIRKEGQLQKLLEKNGYTWT